VMQSLPSCSSRASLAADLSAVLHPPIQPCILTQASRYAAIRKSWRCLLLPCDAT
jgi:hypothetical protein